MDIYAENILDHFRNPRYAGNLADASVVHEEKNLSCGDELRLSLALENGKIAKIGWTGTGCAISQASMSIMSEKLMGMDEDDVLKLTKNDVYAALGIPIGPRRLKCALMSVHTAKNAIYKSRSEEMQNWVKTIGEE